MWWDTLLRREISSPNLTWTVCKLSRIEPCESFVDMTGILVQNNSLVRAFISKFNMNPLQIVQNRALRITGGYDWYTRTEELSGEGVHIQI